MGGAEGDRGRVAMTTRHQIKACRHHQPVFPIFPSDEAKAGFYLLLSPLDNKYSIVEYISSRLAFFLLWRNQSNDKLPLSLVLLYLCLTTNKRAQNYNYHFCNVCRQKNTKHKSYKNFYITLNYCFLLCFCLGLFSLWGLVDLNILQNLGAVEEKWSCEDWKDSASHYLHQNYMSHRHDLALIAN